MGISTPFIRRPIATSLLMAGVLMVGAVAYPLLPVAPLPQVDFPTIQVTAQLPGADPVTMASSVTAPLERQFAQIPGVTQMTSSIDARQQRDHGAVRSQPQYRRRRAGHSDRHQRRRRATAENAAVAARPIARSIRPTRRSSFSHCIPTRCRSPSSTTTPRTSWSRTSAKFQASPRSASTVSRSRRCEFRSIRKSSPRWGSAWKTCAP